VAVFRAEVAAPDGSGTRMVFDDGFAEFRWLTGRYLPSVLHNAKGVVGEGFYMWCGGTHTCCPD
jgi:hypothetical protein